MNTAEATIVFDNRDGRLPVDAPEVHVTRRVYRSGEGEYAINGNPCRLRDIKELFLIVHDQPGAPVHIQKEPEYTPVGVRYDVDYPWHHQPLADHPEIRLSRPADVRVNVEATRVGEDRVKLATTTHTIIALKTRRVFISFLLFLL